MKQPKTMSHSCTIMAADATVKERPKQRAEKRRQEKRRERDEGRHSKLFRLREFTNGERSVGTLVVT